MKSKAMKVEEVDMNYDKEELLLSGDRRPDITKLQGDRWEEKEEEEEEEEEKEKEKEEDYPFPSSVWHTNL